MKEKKSGIDESALDFDNEMQAVEEEPVVIKTRRKQKAVEEDVEKPLVNCLRNERVIVRYINKPSSITDPKHVLFGKMHENAKKTFCVPRLSSGNYVNVLTNDEKDFLENLMGLEHNAMSVYKKQDNFWDDSSDNSLATVTLTKQDSYFNLADPNDYIRVKVLLANKDLIAPSYEAYEDNPKASYLYYITSESAESKKALSVVGNKSQAFLELGKMSTNIPKMRLVLELLTGRPTSPSSKAEFLQIELSKCIEASAKDFVRILADPMLDTKAFIKQCHEAGLLAMRGNWYYLRSDNSPLCEANEEPTLNVAARYLNSPKHQEVLFSLQAKLN